MTQPTPVIDVDVSTLPTTIPVQEGLGGRLTRMGIVYKAVKQLVTWANTARSASDLTTGTLPPARIAQGALSLDKLATPVATTDDLNAVRTVAEAAAAGSGAIQPVRTLTASGPVSTADRNGIVRMRNTADATLTVPLLSNPDGTLTGVDQLSTGRVTVAPAIPNTTLQRVNGLDGLQTRGRYSSLLLEWVRPPAATRPAGFWAVVAGGQFDTAADATVITSVSADAASSVTLPAILPTGAQRPTVHRNAANGRTGMRFNGTSNFLPLTGAWLDLLRNRPNAMIIVTYLVSTAPVSTHRTLSSFSTGLAPTSARAMVKHRDATTNTAVVGGRRTDADTLQFVTATAATSPDLAVLAGRFVWSAADLYALRNGTIAGSELAFQVAGSTDNTSSLAASIGANANGSGEWFPGTILEWAVGPDDPTLLASYQAWLEGFYGEEVLVTGGTT